MAVSYTVKHMTAGCGQIPRLRDTGIFNNYDLAPDVKRFAAFVADDKNGKKPLTH